ncbi:MAG: hypothetical protein SF029_12595 [bacterium]|nr:hypothetical protein [bacterium]
MKSEEVKPQTSQTHTQATDVVEGLRHPPVTLAPLPNYTLSRVCPACDAPTFRLACKVRCARCGFVWDCSEV